MKLITVLGIGTLILGLTACGSQKKENSKTTSEDIVYYTCPMESHKHVHSQQPGNCPDCGMKLVPAVKGEEANADFYGCPMPKHSHIRHSDPGNCEECSMKRVPMKLVKT